HTVAIARRHVVSDSHYTPKFFDEKTAEKWASALLAEMPACYIPREDPRLKFKIYGKEASLPRDKAFFSDREVDEKTGQIIVPFYKYGNITPATEPFRVRVIRVRVRGKFTFFWRDFSGIWAGFGTSSRKNRRDRLFDCFLI